MSAIRAMLFRSRAERDTGDAVNSGRDWLRDRAIGEILSSAKGLPVEQISTVLEYQQQHGVRFGDAAIALGLVKRDDVMWALSQQFHYHYSPATGAPMHEELVMANHPFSDEVESFRDMRSQLLMGPLAASDSRPPLAIVRDRKSVV